VRPLGRTGEFGFDRERALPPCEPSARLPLPCPPYPFRRHRGARFCCARLDASANFTSVKNAFIKIYVQHLRIDLHSGIALARALGFMKVIPSARVHMIAFIDNAAMPLILLRRGGSRNNSHRGDVLCRWRRHSFNWHARARARELHYCASLF
jgi:hypothetical protein